MMNDVTTTRKQRLRTLENQIRRDYEAFVQTGFALKEIRDDELYKEDGFATWDAYLKERVAAEFGIEQTQARELILCAQVRVKLPNQRHAVDSAEEGWSQRELREFARLAPKKEAAGQPYDIEALDKRDVQRVAKKVLAHCEEEGARPTAAVVRKFVDEDLGIDRKAEAAKAKQEAENKRYPETSVLLRDLTGTIEAKTEICEQIEEETWKLLRRQKPDVIRRLISAVRRLAEFLEGVS